MFTALFVHMEERIFLDCVSHIQTYQDKSHFPNEITNIWQNFLAYCVVGKFFIDFGVKETTN